MTVTRLAWARRLRPTQRVAFALAFGGPAFTLLVACGGPPPRAHGPRPRMDQQATGAERGAMPKPGARAAFDDTPSFDELAARRETDAPMMREVVRAQDVAAPIDLKVSSDACFRAIVAGPAGGALRAWFEDGARAPRGGVATEAGLVPPRGPACAQRGETLRFVVDGASSRGRPRVVIWQAP